MKTSKKLLSFFLAVVMVVTTCSVGFTAFAAEKNSSIWTTDATSETSFESIEGLVDEFLPSLLMGIPEVAAGVYQKRAADLGKKSSELTADEKTEIDNTVTTKDIVAALSPVLLKALAGTSQGDFAATLEGDGALASHYNYLQGMTPLDFYSLFTICQNYKDNTDLSRSTRNQLSDWYDILEPLTQKYAEAFAVSDEKLQTFNEKCDELGGDFDNLSEMTLSQVEEACDALDCDLDEDVLEIGLGYYDSIMKNVYRLNVEIDSIAKFLYYGQGLGAPLAYVSEIHYLVNLAGSKVTAQGKMDLGLGELGFEEIDVDIQEDITPDNFQELFFNEYVKAYEAAGKTADDIYFDILGIDPADASSPLTEEQKAEADAMMYQMFLMSYCMMTLGPEYLSGDDQETLIHSPYYRECMVGLAIASGVYSSPRAVDKAAADLIPTITEENKKELAYVTVHDSNRGTGSNGIQKYFSDVIKTASGDNIRNYYTVEYADNGVIVSATLPENLQGTAFSDYLYNMMDNGTSYEYRDGFFRSLLGSAYDSFSPDASTPRDEHGHSIIPDEMLDADPADFQMYLDDITEFAYSQVVRNIFGASYYLDLYTNVSSRISISEVYELTVDPEVYDLPVELELTDEEKAILSDDYLLANEMGVELVNQILNGTILNILEMDIVQEVVAGFVEDLDLVAATKDLWERLYDSPVATVFELLPVVTSALDSLVLPVVLNAEGDKYYNFVNLVLGTFLPQLSAANGSYIALDSVGWDLQELLPDVLNWLFYGKDAEGIEYYDGHSQTLKEGIAETGEFIDAVFDFENINELDFDHYSVADFDNNALTANRNADGDIVSYTYLNQTFEELSDITDTYTDAEFLCTITYRSDVPRLTGVYVADELLAGAKISDLEKLFSKLIDGEDAEAPSQLASALSEAVTEIATLFKAAVDEFISNEELTSQTKYAAKDEPLCSGLNNLFVALPELFDIMENLAAEKYGADKDAWVYCYDGKIVTDSKDSVVNAKLAEFNSFAGSSDPDRSVDILGVFIDVFVGDWLNSILSLVGNALTGDNEIANNIPIISGILTALGGFGEESILTDIFNSIFQITRDNKYTFTFATRENGFNGLSSDNAYFLISNISTLVDVIKNLIAHFGSDDEGENPGTEPSAPSPSPVLSTTPAANAAATNHNYSANDLSNTKDLIGNLDSLLSSLLSDSTINDFSLNSTENLLAGVISLLDKFLGNDVDLGKDLTTDIVILINQYLYFITGESDNLTADGKKVNPKKVYTNNALTGLVVETYALIEKIADRLLNQKDGLIDLSDVYDLGNNNTTKYNLVVEAIDGIISPDAISIRLGDYGNAQDKFAETKYTTWTDMSEASSRSNYSDLKVDWGFKDGYKEGFYEGLAASLRLVTSILGVLFIQTGWYDTVLTPLLGAFCDKNEIELESYEALKADAEATGYYDKTLLAILTPVSEWLTALLNAPASTLIKSIQGLAGLIDDNNTKAGTVTSIVNGLLEPIKNELKGAGKIFAVDSDKLLPTSLKLQEIINDFVDGTLSNLEFTISGTKLKIDANGLAVNGCQITGNNLIPLINTALKNTGITLKQISWSKIYSSTPEAALVYVLEYVIETLLENKNLEALVKLINNDIATMIIDALKAQKIDARDLLALLNTVLEATDSPTLAYWTFAQYLQELTESFKYPAGITKAMADQGVDTLDNLVKNIFPLLGSFGVNLGADDLKGIVDKNLFKNELLTKLAVALYGALDGLDPTIKAVLNGLGIATSTKDVAKLLTDSSYGTTFSSAANTIKAQSSWKNVKNVNWGFTDGSAKAQQGFVNALVAILRPLNDVLNVFLNEGSLELNDVAYEAIMSIDVKTTTAKELKIGGNIVAKITYSMKNGVLTLNIDDAVRERSAVSTVKFDFNAVKDLKDLKIEGTNGYNSAIIPLLEAFKCTNVKTYSQYRSDVNSAKDNLLLDILNPIVGDSSNSLISKLLDKPFAVLTDLLPNIAMYLDAHGLSQLVNNLLAPVTGLIADIAETLDVNAILKAALGSDLNGLVAKYLGVKINIDLTDISNLNLEDIVIPLVNMLLANNGIKIKLPNINWNALISLGDKMTYTSAATGADGKYLTGKMVGNVDQGKVLITVLRYIAQVLTDNASSIKSLILGIDKLKSNKNYDMIASILTSVFNTIGTASADQIVTAIFYLVSSEPTNAFWDYTKYKTGQYSFAYPETVDVDFLKNLPPMLDGLIGGLVDLNGLIAENLFTDSLISKLAKGLYGAVEGVKVGDGSLTALLAQTDIDFSTTNVANLLVDKDYGKTFESAASVIRNAGSWKNVNADSLKWGVTDRDSFFHALVAVLRPLYGVLDVLLNDADLGLFNLIRIPGSNGYTSSIVPLMEAFSMYNVKTQYQYREDINKEYDAILLDIINPIWDKVEDILNAPIQTLMAVVPNLALFIGNDGLCQIIDNLLTPVSALVDALRPIVDLNDLLNALLPALGVNLNSLLGKIGITNFSLDIYDLNKTLKQVLGGNAIIPLVNNILGMIKIKGTPLGLKLNAVDWLQLASHGTTIVSASQAATYGSRIFVEGDSSETLIAFLRYLINTINAGDNFDKISSLIGGLLGDNVADNISDMISQVLGMLQGDTDEVISSLVDLLQTLA